jgi:hypothetical protein
MIGKSRSRLNMVALIGLGLASQACAPLTNGNSGLGSCIASYVTDTPGSQIGLGKQGAVLGLGVSVNTTQLAQSFIATSNASISEMSLKLDAILPAGAQQLSGSIMAEIEPDTTLSTTNPTPNAPSGTGSDVTTAGITANATIPVSTVLSSTPQFYTFTWGSSGSTTGVTASPTPTQGVNLTIGQVYWIVLTSTFGTSSNAYIEWRASNSVPANTVSAYITSTGFWELINSTTFDYELGC